MPVLPLVGSTITVRPRSISPRASASSIIASPIRSLTEPPGLRDSSLTATVAGSPAARTFNLTSGVFPMVLSTAFMMPFIAGLLRAWLVPDAWIVRRAHAIITHYYHA